MLVCLGGFMGSGRHMLAQRICRAHGLYRYDMSSKKMREHSIGADGKVHERVIRPHTDELRIFLYRRILEDLPLQSKMHPEMVLEDAFSRTKPREFFLAEAKKYFDRVVFVWIDSDESHVEARLRQMQRTGIIPSVRKGLRIRAETAKQFQPLAPDILVFKCVHGDAAEAEALWTLITSI